MKRKNKIESIVNDLDNALSRGITSIKNGILRNIMNSMKKEINQFT